MIADRDSENVLYEKLNHNRVLRHTVQKLSPDFLGDGCGDKNVFYKKCMNNAVLRRDALW